MPIPIPRGATIQVVVTFKNINPYTIPDTQWRIGIGRGGGVYPIITDWTRTGPVTSQQQIVVIPQGAIAGDWGEGELIQIALDAEVLNSAGGVLDSQKPIQAWDAYFVVVEPGLDWITFSATPYVVG